MTTLDLSEYIRVVNHTGSTIKGRYDGKDYVFLNDEPTDVHHTAATHIFGFGSDDKTNAFHRLGWLSSMDYEKCMEQLKNIQFEDVPSIAINIKSGVAKRGRPKISSPTPLADADADDGDEVLSSSPTDAEAMGDL